MRLLVLMHVGVKLEDVSVLLQADDTYMQLKKDLEYLDLKVRLQFVLPLSHHCLSAAGL